MCKTNKTKEYQKIFGDALKFIEVEFGLLYQLNITTLN